MSEATQPQSTEQITYLDPRELVPNPRNPRTALGDLDQTAITRLVREARLNPCGLGGERFVVTDRGGDLVGAAQVRRHPDGSREPASLVVRRKTADTASPPRESTRCWPMSRAGLHPWSTVATPCTSSPGTSTRWTRHACHVDSDPTAYRPSRHVVGSPLPTGEIRLQPLRRPPHHPHN